MHLCLGHSSGEQARRTVRCRAVAHWLRLGEGELGPREGEEKKREEVEAHRRRNLMAAGVEEENLGSLIHAQGKWKETMVRLWL